MDTQFDEYKMITCTSKVPWKELQHKTILVAGATGLIGSSVIKAIIAMNKLLELGCHIIAFVRNTAKAKALFGSEIQIIQGEIETHISINDSVDFIINAACPTQSSFMVSNPVDVITASVLGTINLLELAKEKKASFLFLSSMEVYGELQEERLLKEDMLGYLNPLTIRSCYPESKRMCEALVASFSCQYGVNAKSIRLAQTFGPGIDYNDKRVFAMMARCAIEDTEIVLKTKGASKHQYLYVFDAVAAILFVLLFGESGKSYNAGNPGTFCSIFEMGTMVAEQFGGVNCKVRVEETANNIFPNTSYINLDISAISSLGWKPIIGLEEMYQHLIDYLMQISFSSKASD